MFDTEHFISLISKENSIWNTSSKEYHEKIFKHVSWLKVASAIIKDFDTLGEKEKKMKILDLQKKWKNLRDTYSKKCISKSKRFANKRKKYIYSEILEFLRPTMEKKKTESNSNDEDESHMDNGDEIYMDIEDDPENDQDQLFEHNLIAVNDYKTNTDFKNIEINKRSECSTVNAGKADFELLRSFKNQNEEDPDYSFLKSLLPQIKTISEDKKPTLYIELIQTIQRVKNSPLENTKQYNLLPTIKKEKRKSGR